MISLLLVKICIWRTDSSFGLSPKPFSVHPSTLLLQQHYTAGCLLSLPDLVAKLPHYLLKPGLPLYRSAYLQTRPSTFYVTLLPPPPVKTTQPPHSNLPTCRSPHTHQPHSFQTCRSPVVPRSTHRPLRLAPHRLLLQRSLHLNPSRKVRGRLMCQLCRPPISVPRSVNIVHLQLFFSIVV